MFTTGGDMPLAPQRSAVLAPAPRPTAEVSTAVRSAAHLLRRVETRFSESYHESLVQLVPTIQQTTADYGQGVAEGIAHVMLWAATTPDPQDVVEQAIEQAGYEYYQQGFPEDGYLGAGHAMLRAARDVYTDDWNSPLSSAFVAYFSWLSNHLARGARRAQQDGVQAPRVTPFGPAGTAPMNLAQILDRLRRGPLGTNGRALDGVLTRVALRTGADLRSPRPDQHANPSVVANVTAVLQRMGYPVADEPAALPATPAIAPAGRRPATSARWWNRRVPTAPTRTPAPGVTAVDDVAGIPGPGVPRTLTDILDQLRHGPLGHNRRVLDGVLTRVALRTGADLRSPRPDQHANPSVIAEVVAVLQRMGYAFAHPGVGQAALASAAFVPESSPQTRTRWWNRRRVRVDQAQGRPSGDPFR